MTACGRGLPEVADSLLSFFSPRETDTSGIAPHSRRVRRLKVLLPTAALALAAMLILWPALKPRHKPVPQSGSAAVEMKEARFSGFDGRDRAYTITAASMVKSATDDRIVSLARPMADLALAGDSWLAVRSETAILDDTARRLDLDGQVVLFHSGGYTLDMQALVFDFRSGDLWSTTPLTGQGPRGGVKAAGFRLTAETGNLVFTGPATITLSPSSPLQKP